MAGRLDAVAEPPPSDTSMAEVCFTNSSNSFFEVKVESMKEQWSMMMMGMATAKHLRV